ncbi:MAG: MmcQ/YjbR family DNA-binding protein [Flavobacterium psychrophilum]
MNLEQFYDYCLAKPAVTEHFPFDEDTLVFKVGGKMFALTSLKEWENGTPSVNLKGDPERNFELRAEYESIEPGFHMSKTHWNTVGFQGDVSDKLILNLLDESYNLVFSGLTKKAQHAILDWEQQPK